MEGIYPEDEEGDRMKCKGCGNSNIGRFVKSIVYSFPICKDCGASYRGSMKNIEYRNFSFCVVEEEIE